MRKLFVLALPLVLAGCGESDAVKAIESMGYSNVRLTGMPWWGCSDSDDPLYSTKFNATAQNGKAVDGIACGGMMKGYTIRIMSVN